MLYVRLSKQTSKDIVDTQPLKHVCIFFGLTFCYVSKVKFYSLKLVITKEFRNYKLVKKKLYERYFLIGGKNLSNEYGEDYQ